MSSEQQQLPDKGILQIDGKPVTAITFKRHITQEDGCTYDLTASFGGKRVLALKGLKMTEVDEAIGQRNADAIHRRTDGVTQETLRGDKLHYHNGHTEAGRAERERELAQSKSREELQDSPEVAALAKRMGITPTELQKRLQQHEAEQAEQDNKAAGTVRRVDVPSPPPAKTEEQQRETDQERQKLRSEVEKQFLVREGRFYNKDKANSLVMEDRGHKLVTPEKDANMARNMAKLAAAKGWDSIKVSGDPNFKREVWIEASARGIEVKGYTPKEADIAALEARRIARATNEVSKDVPPKAKEQANEQPPKAAPREKGHEGDAAAEAITKAKRKERSDEDAKARQHEAERKSRAPRSERLNTVEAVARAITEKKIRNPDTRKLVEQEVATRLDKMQAKGKEPGPVKVYDKSAQAKQRGPEMPRQQIERNTERTR